MDIRSNIIYFLALRRLCCILFCPIAIIRFDMHLVHTTITVIKHVIDVTKPYMVIYAYILHFVRRKKLNITNHILLLRTSS